MRRIPGEPIQRHSCDQGVRHFAATYANGIRKVSEHRHRRQAGCFRCRPRGRFEALADNAARTFNDQRRGVGRDADLDPQVFERDPLSERQIRVRIGHAVGQQNRVHSARHAKVALQPLEWHEHGPDLGLLWLQGELPELLPPERTGDGEAHRAGHVFFLREERLQRNLRGALQPGQEHVPFSRRQLRRQRGGHIHALSRLDSVEPPEPLVHTVDQDAGGPPPG